MATFTDNFALVKPTYGELADVAVINGNMDTVDGIMHSNRTMLAPAFSQTEDYAVGDIVVYEGNLYRFIVPHTAGNWDGTEVEQTTLGEEVATKGGADVTKTASGNPIEITDGASAPLVKCDVSITGSQDLHGYDKPWVGGAGKNKLPLVLADIKSFNTTGTWSGSSYTVNGVTLTIITDNGGNITGVEVNGTATETIYFKLAQGLSFLGAFNGTYTATGAQNGGNDGTYAFQVYSDVGGIYINVYSAIDYAVKSDSTPTANIDSAYITIRSGYTASNLMFHPMIRLSTVTDPTFTPYSNICPITAYTEGEIEVRGKNILDRTNDVDGYSMSQRGATTVNADMCYSALHPVETGETYTFSGISAVMAYKGVIGFDASGNYVVGCGATSSQTVVGNPYSVTFTVPNGVTQIRTSFGINDTKVQIEKGSSATDYEPYKGVTHTTTYPSAIYRGSEDVVKGEVESEWPVIELPSTGWMQEGDYAGVYANYSFGVSNSYPKLICSVATRGTSYSNILNNDGRIAISASRIIWHESSFASANDLMTYLSNNVVQIAYELATPQTSSVTPTNLPIKSLSGYTHIESSTGDMEVEYITSEFQPLVDLIQESGGDSHTYSTTEQVVGKWIDGSNVYEKTYDIGYLTSNNKTIAHGISGFGHIIQIHGYVTNDTYDFHLPHVTTDAASCVGVHADSTNIYITSYDRSDYHGYVIIQYTKSTPTRSLNLTKSAVEEIPDEIKNAPFEEKPDYNEADDDAPTEVDER